MVGKLIIAALSIALVCSLVALKSARNESTRWQKMYADDQQELAKGDEEIGKLKAQLTLLNPEKKSLIAPAADSKDWSKPVEIELGKELRWSSSSPLLLLKNGKEVMSWDGKQNQKIGSDVKSLQFKSANNTTATVTYFQIPFLSD